MNSNINIIGSIADTNVIFQFLSDRSLNSSHDYLSKIRTSKSKERIINCIKSAFASYASVNHESLLVTVFEHENLNQLKSFALFLQFNYTNKLFFLLNKNLLIKSIWKGKVNLSSKDVIAFISSLKETEIDLKGWSESTIITVVFEECIKEKLELIKRSVCDMSKDELDRLEELLNIELKKLDECQI